MANEKPQPKLESFPCSKQEIEVIKLMRTLSYGEVTVSMKNAEPVRVELHRSVIIK
ncbi:MAG: hypothetical protein KBS46_08100 [Clostridiales bacterium]|nr:hypothetical protein [Candidatus Apopatocola equi]